MRDQLKVWDSNREREKINRPEHTASRSQNKGSEQVQRRAHQLRTGPAPPEAGGRGEGKGAGSAPRTTSLITVPTGLQFLTKDFLRFWMVIGRECCGSAQGAGTRPDQRGRGWGCGGEKARRTQGKCARQASGCLSCLGQGRHKTQAQPSLCFCGTYVGCNCVLRRARSI